MMENKETFNNLIDFCTMVDEDQNLAGKGVEIFQFLLSDYFFKTESAEKTMLNLFKKFKHPEFIPELKSLTELESETWKKYVNGNTINDSLSGKIYLSEAYLKTFNPDHSPEFKKLPSNAQQELIDKIKLKNRKIINAVKKMHQDIEADKSRTLLKLIALIIKNIYKKHALPLAASSANAKEYILKNFPDCNKIFSGAQNQLADLNDNLKIKEIIKKFFTIKKFDEIQMITEKFKEELKRYEKRAKRIQT